MDSSFRRCLFVGAHLDDIEIAAGGTAARVIAEGGDAYFLVLTDSSYRSLDGSEGRDAAVALAEGVESAKQLGVTELDVRDFPSKDLENSSIAVEIIELVIENFEPTAIFTHWPFDTHKSHVNASLTTIAAARRHPSILMYEPFYPSGRSYVPFRPQAYINIDDFSNTKKCALQSHASEYAKFGESWIEAIEARARLRGYEVGVKYAESFEVLRTLV